MTDRSLAGLSTRDAALAGGAAWLAFMSGLVAGGDVEDAGSLAIAAAIATVVVVVGFAAAWRCRSLPARSNARRVRLGLWSLGLGVLLGLANLGANWLIAAVNPTLRELLVERMAGLAPLTGVVAAPLVEEVTVRLFLMSAMAWLVSLATGRASIAFVVALAGSSFVFALLHLARPVPGDPGLADFYRAALIVKYTLAGLPLGWAFWHWGLPYAILCHVAANAAHLAIQSRLF